MFIYAANSIFEVACHMALRPVYHYFLLLLAIAASCPGARCQLLGGNTPYRFLDLPNNPQLSALGSINISTIGTDAGIAFNNPALLRQEMDHQLELSFNAMPAGVNNYHALFAWASEKWKTNFDAGVHFIDYGNIPQTDAAGNTEGIFHPADYVAQASASRQYLSHWYYGATLKFVHSNYGLYRSAAVAMDIGATWYDSVKLFQVSLVMRNMGFQLRKYDGARGESLPFDLQAGITKRLENAPIQFSATAHHLYRFDLSYSDTAFNNANGFEASGADKSFSVDKLFSHFVFAVQVFVTDKIELSAGYNHLRRKELSVPGTPNGLSGFSMGVGVLLKKLRVRYAHSNYLNGKGYDQFGMTILFGRR
jgi:hypothetical protein